jgi:hypothetical protein
MFARVFLALLVTVLLTAVAGADTTIVDENFDGYADTTAMEVNWQPDTTGPVGILVPDLGAGLTPPNDDPPNIQGKAVNILSDVNEYVGGGGLPAGVVPSAMQSVRLSADFFDDTVGNKRDTVGIRSTSPSNIIELGFWNAETFDPEDPDNAPPPPPAEDQPVTDYAYRIVLFGTIGGDLVREPDWQYFPLDPSLDFNDDGLVDPADIGSGWHRFSAEISLAEVTVTLDLFRDGLTNTAINDPNFSGQDPNFGSGKGTPGVDSSVTWQIEPSGAPDAFDSLRFGAPSSISSAFETVVDNILLELIDIGVGGDDADFNDDNIVDGLDFLTWQLNSGLMGGAMNADGDANGDSNVDGADLGIWESQYGGPPPLAAIAAVPEPVSGVLLMIACGCWGAFARRR